VSAALTFPHPDLTREAFLASVTAQSTPDEVCLRALNLDWIKVDPVTGMAWATRFGDKQLGCLSARGYVVFTVHVDGVRKQCKMHRLIWLAAKGAIPAGFVPDHLNRIKTDNRIENLALVTPTENAANRRSLVGAANPAVKINLNIANQIRQRHIACGSSRRTAVEFGVSQTLVLLISNNKMWRPEVAKVAI